MRLVTLRHAALLCWAMLLGAGNAHAQANGGAFISNGTVQLGVNRDGSLNVAGGPRSSGKPISTTIVGLRYVPTGAEGTADGCLCEGWGAADRLSGLQGGANQTSHGITGFNLTLESFTVTSSTATSRVRINNTFRVTHNYRPSLSPNLYQVDVTIENISSNTTEMLYRRAIDWDIEPTPFAEFVTIVTRNPATGQYPSDLIFSSDNGFVDSRVLSPPVLLRSGFVAGPTGLDRADNGPADHGAVFDFNFGAVPPGGAKTFRIFYGAAGNEADALTAIAAVGAELYSLGQSSVAGGPTLGTPNTFILAFAGVGGAPALAATGTTTTLSASSTDSTFRAPVTLTATVEAAEGIVAPAGSIQFRDGATVLGTATLPPVSGTAQSTASFTTSALAIGERSITAAYSGGRDGDVRFRASESATLPIFVDKAAVTITGVNSASYEFGTTSIVIGGFVDESIDLAPTGSVIAIVNGLAATAAVQPDGRFSIPMDIGSLNAGTYSIACEYTGDANFQGTLVEFQLTVTKAKPLVTVAGGTFRYDGLPHAAVADVRGIDGAPLGPVSVTYNGSADVPVGAGSYAVTVSYAGNINYESASDTSASILVERAPLTITTNDAVRILGDSNSAFSVRYAGFVPGETAAQLLGSLVFTTPATPSSRVGTYPIVASGVSSPNYAISFIEGTLTISYNVCALYDPARAHRSGSTVPLKLQLCDVNGANASSSMIQVSAKSLNRLSAAALVAVEDAGQANPDANFRYDASFEGYIFNLRTTGLPTGTYRLTFSAAGDPTAHFADFQVR